MQTTYNRSYCTMNRSVLETIAGLIDRHPTLRLNEILERFNIIKIDESDRQTAPDTILARTHLKMHELTMQHINRM